MCEVQNSCQGHGRRPGASHWGPRPLAQPLAGVTPTKPHCLSGLQETPSVRWISSSYFFLGAIFIKSKGDKNYATKCPQGDRTHTHTPGPERARSQVAGKNYTFI